MPRRKRLVIPGLPHHVTQRGGRRQNVFFVPGDRLLYLDLLRSQLERHRVEVLAYCLMTNHVHHLLIPSDATGLSRALQVTHKKYAYAINQRNGWTGHLWQERFYSSPVDQNSTLTVAKYIERNPVEAYMVEHACDYQWSSAKHHCKMEHNRLLSNLEWWNKERSYIDNWYSWLSDGNDDLEITKLRKCTSQDLPFGSEQFISELETELGAHLRPRKRGRPRKM